jgi:hypothetical protein
MRRAARNSRRKPTLIEFSLGTMELIRVRSNFGGREGVLPQTLLLTRQLYFLSQWWNRMCSKGLWRNSAEARSNYWGARLGECWTIMNSQNAEILRVRYWEAQKCLDLKKVVACVVNQKSECCARKKQLFKNWWKWYINKKSRKNLL